MENEKAFRYFNKRKRIRVEVTLLHSPITTKKKKEKKFFIFIEERKWYTVPLYKINNYKIISECLEF